MSRGNIVGLRLQSSWTALYTEDMCLCRTRAFIFSLTWMDSSWPLISAASGFMQPGLQKCHGAGTPSSTWDNKAWRKKAGTFGFKEGEMSLSALGFSVSDLSRLIMSRVWKVVSQQRHTRERNAEQVVETARCPRQHIWSLRLLLLSVSRRRRRGKEWPVLNSVL